MNRLDRYLTIRMLLAATVIVALLSIFVLGIDTLLRIEGLLEGELGPNQNRLFMILQLAVMRLPQIISPLIPIALVGSLIIVSSPMLRHGELIALVANGLSLRRCFRSALLLAALCGIGDVILSDQVIPRLETPTQTLEDTLLGASQRGQTWVIDENESAWYVHSIELRVDQDPKMHDVIVSTRDHQLHHAGALLYQDAQWSLSHNVMSVDFSQTPPVTSYTHTVPCRDSFHIPYSPTELAAALASRYALTGPELWQRGGRLNLALAWQRWLRIITPLSVILLALPIMVRFANRHRLLTAAIQTLALACLPIALQGLGHLAGESSDWPLALTISLTAFATMTPGLIVWLRWHH